MLPYMRPSSRAHFHFSCTKIKSSDPERCLGTSMFKAAHLPEEGRSSCVLKGSSGCGLFALEHARCETSFLHSFWLVLSEITAEV